MGITNQGSMDITIPHSCITLNGSSTCVDVPDHSSLDMTDKVTCSCWLNLHKNKTWSTILCKGDALTWTGDNYVIGLGGLKFYCNLGGENQSYDNAVELNKWVHLAFTADTTTTQRIEMYVNGEWVIGKAATVADVANNQEFHIGVNDKTGAEWLSGQVHDVRVYNAALTSDQIKQIYNGIDVTDNLVGNWKLNSEYVSGCTDSSTESNDGYASGSGYVWDERSIQCWGTRWDEGNWDMTMETFMDACDRNFLFRQVTPGAVRELYNILGTPCYIDTTYESSNTLTMTPISGYGLSSLREERMIGVKNISDTFINKDYYNVKIEGYRLDI